MLRDHLQGLSSDRAGAAQDHYVTHGPSVAGWVTEFCVVTRRLIEIESLADFDAHISRTQRLNGWFVQSVDLTERSSALLKVDPRGAVFLGCLFEPAAESHLRESGALLFPRLPELPLTPTEHVRTTRRSCMAPGTTP